MKEKIRNWILNSALKIGDLSNSERASLELIVILYLIVCMLSLTIGYGLSGNAIAATLYSIAMASFLLMFISKSVQYRMFKFTEQLINGN